MAAVVGYLLTAWWAKRISLPGTVLIWFPPAGVAIGVLFLRPRLLPHLVVADIISTVAIMRLGREFGGVGLLVNSTLIVTAYALGAEAMRRLDLSPTLRSSEDVVA